MIFCLGKTCSLFKDGCSKLIGSFFKLLPKWSLWAHTSQRATVGSDMPTYINDNPNSWKFVPLSGVEEPTLSVINLRPVTLLLSHLCSSNHTGRNSSCPNGSGGKHMKQTLETKYMMVYHPSISKKPMVQRDTRKYHPMYDVFTYILMILIW